jgi:hypothetical protein
MKATKEKGSKKNENIQRSKGVFWCVCILYKQPSVERGDRRSRGGREGDFR